MSGSSRSTPLPSPALNQQENGQSSTPTTAHRRSFGLFSKRTVSNEGQSATLAYQPRIQKHPKAVTPTEIQNEQMNKNMSYQPASSPSTPRASTSTPTNASQLPSLKRATPGHIHIVDSALQMQKELDESSNFQQVEYKQSPYSRESARTPPTAVPRHWQNNTEAKISNLRKPSWLPHHGHSSRLSPRRTISSPLDSRSNEAKKGSDRGAKPVTSSYHPDAPPALKVKPPTNPVLLPFLSIPGAEKIEEDAILSSTSSPTSPPDFKAEDVIKSATIKLQRPAIKVRIITWNQGSSVPKGNLEVLLGRVGEYIPPQEGWDVSSDEEDGDEDDANRKHRGMGVAGQKDIPRNERIPPLPHDDAHPYHVVVIAGQECPWGDGKRIATGVGLAGELGDLGRSKSRAAQHAKAKEAASKERKEGGMVSSLDDKNAPSAIEGEFPFSEQAKSSVPSTPAITIPSTPGGAGAMGVAGVRGIGGKGWSDMCEDWLCRGPLAQATATKGLALASKGAISPSPVLSPVPTPEDGMTPAMSRSVTPTTQLQMGRSESMASLSIQTQNLSDASKLQSQGPPPSNNVIAQDHFYNAPPKRSSLAVPRNLGRSISFVTRSRETLEGTSSPIEERSEEELLHSSPSSRPVSPLKQSIDNNARIPAHQQKPLPGKPHHRLALHIPGLSAAHHVTVQSDGTPLSLGAYELVAKERCYMMYMAVYVWRGCLDRVVKTSQGHVKSGLLAGRVGNKGAVGISLKLGSSRLLFVNAHLAAHEGKVAERVANVEKIKKELKVDTFLPDGDPRNKEDDLTAAFDYAFWFGDLNFRVDISRQHADWLLMKKQYNDALAFDQLKKIMKEQPEVFNGFSEAPITFPPTFKYDVLKTIKQKREEKAKRYKSSSVFSKGGDSDGNVVAGDASKISAQSGSNQTSEAASSQSQPLPAGPGRSKPSMRIKANGSDQGQDGKKRDGDDDTSSISSSGWGGSNISGFAGGNQSDREESANSYTSLREGDSSLYEVISPIDPVVSNNTAAVEGHKIHGKAIKVKKRILDAVHSFGQHHHIAKSKEEHLPQIVKAARSMKENGKSHGQVQMQDQDSGDEMSRPPSTSTSQDGGEYYNSDLPLSPSSTRHSRRESYSTVSNSQPNARAPVLRRRSSAGDLDYSIDTESNNDESNGMNPSSSLAAMAEEYEKQPYDTSAKQRVPSWCDRVLWKSNIKVEKEEVDGDASLNRGIDNNSHGLHSRVGTAISNVLGSHHRRSGVPRSKSEHGPTVTFAPNPASPSERQRRSIGSPQRELPSPPILGAAASGQLSPTPKRKWFYKKGSNQQMKRSATMEPNDLTKLTSNSHPSIGKRTMSEVDLTSLSRHESGMSGNLQMPALRPRRSSLEVPRKHRTQKCTSPSDQEKEKDVIHEHASGSPSLQVNGKNTNEHHETRQTREEISPSSALASLALRSAPPIVETINRRTSWWNDHVSVHLPSFLAINSLSNLSSSRNEANQTKEKEEDLIGPRKGEIECLLYKSLDDREMRLLEGRSDHRPVIWVGNIGV